MAVLPDAVLNYLGNLMINNHALAYLLVDRAGHLIAFGGELNRYGMNELSAGQSMSEPLFFLEGILPFEGPPLCLNYVKIGAGLSADIHIFSGEAGDWVLMLDVSEAEDKYGRMQQRVNDLSLLNDQHLRIIDRHISNRILLKEHLRMGLDAVVFTNKNNLPFDLEKYPVLVDEQTGESYFEDRSLYQKIHKQIFIGNYKRLGNISEIAALRDEILALIGSDNSVLIKSILYSGAHSGDTIGLDIIDKLILEINTIFENAAKKRSSALDKFFADILELTAEAQKQKNPIVFV